MPASAWRTLDVSIDIDAAPEAVWTVLADVRAYREWNPFIVAFEPGPSGELTPGEVAQLRVRMRADSDKTIQSPERVIAVEPCRSLAWVYVGLPTWLLDATRYQELTPTEGGGTRYRTHQTYRGPLAPLVLALYRRHILAGFEATAAALKARIEGGGP